MNKILLVYEDYTELMSVEAMLKKVGFDVLGLSSEYSISQQMLAFNPDLVVGSGRGGKVSSLGVGKRLKEMQRWQGKVVLLFPANFKPGPQDLIRIRVDMVLESTVTPLRLMQVIGRLLGHDESVLLERLNKNITADTNGKLTFTGGAAKQNSDGEAIYVKGQVNEGTGDSTQDSDFKTGIVENKTFSPSSTKSSDEKFSFKFGDRVSAEQTTKEKTFGSAADNTAEAFPDVDLNALEQEILGGGAPAVERIDTSSNFESSDLSEDIQALLNSDTSKGEVKISSTEEKRNEVVSAATSKQADNEGGKDELKSSAKNTAKDSVDEPLKEAQKEASKERTKVFAPGTPSTKETPASGRKETTAAGDDSASGAALGEVIAAEALAQANSELPQKIARYTQLVKDVKLSPKSTVTRVEARRRQKQLSEDFEEKKLNELDELRREFTKAMFKK